MNSAKPAKHQSLRQPYPWEVYRETDERLYVFGAFVRRLFAALEVVGIGLAVVVLFLLMGYLVLMTSGPNSLVWP